MFFKINHHLYKQTTQRSINEIISILFDDILQPIGEFRKRSAVADEKLKKILIYRFIWT